MKNEMEILVSEREHVRKCMNYQWSKLEGSRDCALWIQRIIEAKYSEYSIKEMILTNQINGLRDGVVETLQTK